MGMLFGVNAIFSHARYNCTHMPNIIDVALNEPEKLVYCAAPHLWYLCVADFATDMEPKNWDLRRLWYLQ